jgi:hypothetical protein
VGGRVASLGVRVLAGVQPACFLNVAAKPVESTALRPQRVVVFVRACPDRVLVVVSLVRSLGIVGLGRNRAVTAISMDTQDANPQGHRLGRYPPAAWFVLPQLA